VSEQQRIVAKLDEQMAALDRADMALAEQQAAALAFKRAALQTALDQATHPEWKCATLGELCTFANGLWTGKKPPFQQVSVIRNTNFTSDCTLDFSDIAHLDVEERQLRSRRLRAGNIILERSGGGPKQPVGRVALFELDDESYSFSNFTSVIRVNECSGVLPRFLWYYLFHLHNSGATEALQNHTSGIRNLDFNAYVMLSIPVPTFDEQRRIVEHLDRSIEQTNNLLSYVAGQALTLVSLRTSFLDAAFSGET
jgi:type I restriction enzyme S subunit